MFTNAVNRIELSQLVFRPRSPLSLTRSDNEAEPKISPMATDALPFNEDSRLTRLLSYISGVCGAGRSTLYVVFLVLHLVIALVSCSFGSAAEVIMEAGLLLGVYRALERSSFHNIRFWTIVYIFFELAKHLLQVLVNLLPSYAVVLRTLFVFFAGVCFHTQVPLWLYDTLLAERRPVRSPVSATLSPRPSTDHWAL